MEYNFKDHKKGDTFPGVSFKISVNGLPLNLTGASIKMQLRELTPTGAVGATFTDLAGITIDATPTSGIFVFDKQVIDIPAVLYYFDIQITLASGDIKTYIEGTWNITQDRTT